MPRQSTSSSTSRRPAHATTSASVGDGTSQAIFDPQADNFWGVIMTFNAAGVATDIASPGFYLTGSDTRGS